MEKVAVVVNLKPTSFRFLKKNDLRSERNLADNKVIDSQTRMRRPDWVSRTGRRVGESLFDVGAPFFMLPKIIGKDRTNGDGIGIGRNRVIGACSKSEAVEQKIFEER